MARATRYVGLDTTNDGELLAEVNALPLFHPTREFDEGLSNLGFYSSTNLVRVLRVLGRKTSTLPPEHAFKSMAADERNLWVAERMLGTLDLALFKDPVLRRKALYLLGKTHLHIRNERIALEGTRFIQMAFHGGEVNAGIDTAAAEMLMSNQAANNYRGSARTSLVSRQMFQIVKENALLKNDHRSLTLYLYDMSGRRLTKAESRDCYELALDLCRMTEPAPKPREDNPWYLEKYLAASWNILYSSAERYLQFLPDGAEHDLVQSTMRTALRDGLDNWKDPDAIPLALRDSNVIQRHSTEWIDLATQAATLGMAQPAFDLAMYHLGKAGWRPKSPLRKPQDWTGIQWLATSAANSRSDEIAMREKYVALAYLLREHGYAKESYYWLDFAKEFIAEAGLDPSKEIQETFNNIAKAWKEAESDKSWEKHLQSSEELLSRYLDDQDKLW